MFGPYEIDYNLQSFLDILGLTQGITLGFLLLLLNYKHHRSTFFLGLYLLLFSLKLAYFIPKGLNLEHTFPELFLLPFNFSWLLFPVFFVYTQKISVFSDKKIKFWVLYPGLASFALQVLIYFQPYSVKLLIADSPMYKLVFTFLGIFYAWTIGIWNLILLKKHKIEVENTFSSIEYKVLHWARFFLIYSITTSIIIHLLYFLSPQNYFFKIIFSIIDLIAIYWVAINGIKQRDVLLVLPKNMTKENNADSSTQRIDIPMYSNESHNNFMKEIDKYVKESECFTQKELTIIDLAENLNVHPKRISTTINSVLCQNFNNYINELRIKKAQALLKSKSSKKLSIEGIGQEVGFQSKSAFYSAFKKFTGTTPTKYKEKNRL
tara:strand:+ start:187 stop:1320 length:1134 start_codon:yes stop_codon:yes gene_type:complete